MIVGNEEILTVANQRLQNLTERGRSLQSRDSSRMPRPLEFRSTLDYYTRQLKLEDRFSYRRPEEARFLDVSGGPKIDYYVENVESNRKDFSYSIHKDVQEQDYV